MFPISRPKSYVCDSYLIEMFLRVKSHEKSAKYHVTFAVV